MNYNIKFLDSFTKEEMKDIVDNATVVIENCIMINTKDYFFELSIDNNEEVDIFCYSSVDSSENKLSKLEFIKFYKSNQIEEIDIINIEE